MKSNQLLLNLKDNTKTEMLIEFLKSLNYVSVQQLDTTDFVVSEKDKKIMRERKKKAKPENFKNWDDIKNSFL